MKCKWLFFGFCIIVLSACNLAYRRPESAEPANINEQVSEFAKSTAPETLVALPTDALIIDRQVSCIPRIDWMVYVVVGGDTLSGIAVRSRSTVAELAEANCLDNPRLIIEGQRIYVRQQPVTPTPVHDHSLGTDTTGAEYNQ